MRTVWLHPDRTRQKINSTLAFVEPRTLETDIFSSGKFIKTVFSWVDIYGLSSDPARNSQGSLSVFL